MLAITAYFECATGLSLKVSVTLSVALASDIGHDSRLELTSLRAVLAITVAGYNSQLDRATGLWCRP